MAKKPSWGLIIFGIAILVVVVGAGVLAVVGYIVYQQFAFEASPSTGRNVDKEFEEVAKRFAGQKPLIEIRDGEPVANREPAPTGKGGPIEAIHILVWQPDERKVFRMKIPFWLIRMSKGRPIRLSGDEWDEDPVKLRLTPEDLERHGPGLILDYKKPGGERVLVWAE